VDRKSYKVRACRIHMGTTIRLRSRIRKKLDAFKVHSTESYSDVISRIVDERAGHDVDDESLSATFETLFDPEALRDIREALKDYENGKFVELI